MFSWRRAGILHRRNQHQLYRPPEKKTFARWKELAPPGFVFAVKASRFITHMKRLKDVEGSLELFVACLEPLRSSLGPVLFQLPLKWKVNVERLSQLSEPPSEPAICDRISRRELVEGRSLRVTASAKCCSLRFMTGA